MKTMTRVFALAIVCILCGCGPDYRERFEQTEAHQRELARAVFTLWVDDCGGMAPEIDVLTPNRLTSPIAYAKPEALQDPFGARGERMLYIPTYHFRNSGMIAVISRGPDGEFESLLLPKTYELLQPIELPDGTVADIGERANAAVSASARYNTRHVFEVRRYRDSTGVWHDNPTIRIRELAKPEKRSTTQEEYKQTVMEWFIKNGAPPYDPTNGTVSRGDLIRLF